MSELEAARLSAGEDEQLEAERRRLANLEKLTELCSDAYNTTYEESDSTVARLSRLERQVDELSQYEASYKNYMEGVGTARVVLEDLSAQPARLPRRADLLARAPGGDREPSGGDRAAQAQVRRNHRERARTLRALARAAAAVGAHRRARRGGHAGAGRGARGLRRGRGARPQGAREVGRGVPARRRGFSERGGDGARALRGARQRAGRHGLRTRPRGSLRRRASTASSSTSRRTRASLCGRWRRSRRAARLRA